MPIPSPLRNSGEESVHYSSLSLVNLVACINRKPPDVHIKRHSSLPPPRIFGGTKTLHAACIMPTSNIYAFLKRSRDRELRLATLLPAPTQDAQPERKLTFGDEKQIFEV
jgi:hypothetical protein